MLQLRGDLYLFMLWNALVTEHRLPKRATLLLCYYVAQPSVGSGRLNDWA